tara:strand:+ start:75 stop:551 length:477 start_codon:yes stop_codon:yes gene_type:complete
MRFLLPLLLCFQSCATGTYQSLSFGAIDPNNKTISVPGAGPGLFEIKSALINDGWKVKIGDSSLSETGAMADEVNTTTKVQYETAYRMYMTTTLSGNRNHGITTFNISIVDNKSNEEVLNMVGNREDYARYAPEDIARNLINNLNGKQAPKRSSRQQW